MMPIRVLFLLAALLPSAHDKRPVHLFMIGDSTMSDFSENYYPEMGWGQVMREFFTGKVKVSNHAKSGRSSKSFRHEGFWHGVLNDLHPGDYVLVQFGHNDSKPDTARYTDPQTSYRANLVRYVAEIRARGAHPVLCTSIVRRKFDRGNEFVDTLDDYPKVTREVAQLLCVPVIDLHARTMELVKQLGPEKSKSLFLHFGAGTFPAWPDGKSDDTHLSPEGARRIAALAVKEMIALRLPLAKYLKYSYRKSSEEELR